MAAVACGEPMVELDPTALDIGRVGGGMAASDAPAVPTGACPAPTSDFASERIAPGTADALLDGDEDGAQAADDDESGPTRLCIATRERRPPENKIRFVISPDGVVVPDLDERLPGRGLWLSSDAEALSFAITRKAFARAARRPVVAPDGLSDVIPMLLAKRCIDAVGLARRAGTAIGGFEKVVAHLRAVRAGGGSFRPGVLLTAADASQATDEKMAEMATPLGGSGTGNTGVLARVTVLTAEELGQSFGRDRFVHVLIGSGKLAKRLQRDCARLAGFRAGATSARDQRSDRTDGGSLRTAPTGTKVGRLPQRPAKPPSGIPDPADEGASPS